MSRPFTPKIVTANDLRMGDVVYLTSAGQWSRFHSEAALFTVEDDANAALASAAAQHLLVVGAYLAVAKAGPAGPEPVHFREIFRTRGPSNYAHGKQVDLRAPAKVA
ncbi:MAG: DUF2849 domain-containing protein [Cypionkella sp.]|nr:DUF2849 domain-containing protein [Cypionkella sp.]